MALTEVTNDNGVPCPAPEDRREPVVVTCGKCKTPYTRAEFDALPKLPDQRMEWGELLEFRNCPCRSTITVSSSED
jgi:hypothetical protein